MQDKSSEIKEILEPIISTIHSKSEAQSIINKWINGRYGKIIGWKIRTQDHEENYHLIFDPDGVRLNVGEYPAFDIMMIGDPETILGILKGEKHIDAELKQRRVMIWGNLNEGIIFQKVLHKIRKM
ncbi:MAG: SCP2 sterol-binding domain-containing protein [Candidatus Helarchaeota archaeon]